MQYQKHQKSKLLTRFNISLNSQKQISTHSISHHLNTSREHMNADDCTTRYKNHIKFLQYRVEQQQGTIQKLELEVQASTNAQMRLNAQVVKLQRSNKNMLENLYIAENKIRELEEENNNQMLNQSIQKLQHQLSMSQARKRNRTLEDFDNPQKSTKSYRKSMKTSQRISAQSQQPSYRLTSLLTYFKTSQAFSITIKPTEPCQKSQKSHIQKLELAIYTLKKQQKEEQKRSMQIIEQLKLQLSAASEKTKIHVIDSKIDSFDREQNKKLVQKIEKLENQNRKLNDSIIAKDKEIQAIEQKYKGELMEAQSTLTTLNSNIHQVISAKDSQMQQLEEQHRSRTQKLTQLQNQHNRLQTQIIELTKKMTYQNEQHDRQIRSLLEKINLLSQQNNEQREKFTDKQLQCLELTQNLSVKEDELFQLKGKQNQSPKEDKNLQETISAQIQELKAQLHRRSSLLQEESLKNTNLMQKNNTLSEKVSTLQSMNSQMCSKQSILSSSLTRANQQLADLQNEKQQKNREVNKLATLIRRLEGDVAQKQQLLDTLTQQMLQIKDKLTTTKQDAQTQYYCEKAQQLIDQGTNQPTLEQLQQHFGMILGQKQQQHNRIANELQANQQVKYQLENELSKVHLQITGFEQQIENKNQQIFHLNQKIIQLEEQIRESRDQIRQLKKTVEQLQQKQSFYMEYIEKIKAVDV